MKTALTLTWLFTVGCIANLEDEEATDLVVNPDVIQSELSEAQPAGLSGVSGCHLYVGSNYGGQTLRMSRQSTISDLHAHSMGDKISSIRLRGGATLKLWIDKNHRGSSWYITRDVATFHTSPWGNLGDNASSADCY